MKEHRTKSVMTCIILSDQDTKPTAGGATTRRYPAASNYWPHWSQEQQTQRRLGSKRYLTLSSVKIPFLAVQYQHMNWTFQLRGLWWRTKIFNIFADSSYCNSSWNYKSYRWGHSSPWTSMLLNVLSRTATVVSSLLWRKHQVAISVRLEQVSQRSVSRNDRAYFKRTQCRHCGTSSRVQSSSDDRHAEWLDGPKTSH